jgi:glycosyltransferase involved in cell wall biosynthesis
MKIVHVEDFFHPDAGYQVNLLSRLQQAEGHQVTVVTAELDRVPSVITGFFGTDRIVEKDRAFERESNGVKIMRVPLLGYFSGRCIFHPKVLKVVSDEKPDVVFVHGEDTLTGMIFIWLADLLPFPIVLDCHMLEMASVNRFREYFRSFYRRFVTPTILRRNIPLIRVVDSNFVEKCLGIPLSHTDLLSFGTDTSYFVPDPERRRQVRAELGFDDNAFVIMYAGKMDESKGGMILADTLHERFPEARGRPIQCLVIGNTDGEFGKKVDARLKTSENKLVRLPTQRYFDLARYYQAADLAVFAQQCSMSFFEAQSCGLPVLFEVNEMNVLRTSQNNAFTFTPGSVEDFRRQILSLANLSDDAYAVLRKNARDFVLARYDYVPIARQFTSVLERARRDWLAQNERPLRSRVVDAFVGGGR